MVKIEVKHADSFSEEKFEVVFHHNDYQSESINVSNYGLIVLRNLIDKFLEYGQNVEHKVPNQ